MLWPTKDRQEKGRIALSFCPYWDVTIQGVYCGHQKSPMDGPQTLLIAFEFQN